jgi:hypothetical protein
MPWCDPKPTGNIQMLQIQVDPKHKHNGTFSGRCSGLGSQIAAIFARTGVP